MTSPSQMDASERTRLLLPAHLEQPLATKDPVDSSLPQLSYVALLITLSFPILSVMNYLQSVHAR